MGQSSFSNWGRHVWEGSEGGVSLRRGATEDKQHNLLSLPPDLQMKCLGGGVVWVFFFFNFKYKSPCHCDTPSFSEEGPVMPALCTSRSPQARRVHSSVPSSTQVSGAPGAPQMRKTRLSPGGPQSSWEEQAHL